MRAADIPYAKKMVERKQKELAEAQAELARLTRRQERIQPMVEHYLSMSREDLDDVLSAAFLAHEMRGG